MAYDLPTAWKMDGLELSIEQKLNYLAAHVAALEEAGGGGSTVTVTSEYTEQTYNNKLATITIDETPTTINAPKVTVTPKVSNSAVNADKIAEMTIGSTSKNIYQRKHVIVTDDDIDADTNKHTIYISYQDLGSYMSVSCLPIVRVVTSNNDGSESFEYFPLEKLYTTYNSGTDTYTYFAKFGSRTYSNAESYQPMELVTT